MVIGLAGLVTADGIYYFLGYWGGERVLKWKIFSLRGSLEGLQEAEKRYQRQGWWAVFAARFAPFIRMVIFLVAGMSRMSPQRFFLADGLSALVYVPVLCLSGYLFSENRQELYRHVKESEEIVAAVIVLGAAALLAWAVWKRRKGR
jgi:membrane protein DedA with SNARE-associated domain